MTLSKQDFFNKTWNVLKERGFTRATNVNNKCLYRSPNGPCAIGVHIPDEIYRESMEGRGCAYIATKVTSLSNFTIMFLEDIQRAHDFGISPEAMEDYLRKFAKQYKLKIPK